MPVVVQTWRKTSTRPIARTATTATAAANRRGRIVRVMISAPLRHRAEPCVWLDLKNLVLELDTVRGYRGPAEGVKSGYGGGVAGSVAALRHWTEFRSGHLGSEPRRHRPQAHLEDQHRKRHGEEGGHSLEDPQQRAGCQEVDVEGE